MRLENCPPNPGGGAQADLRKHVRFALKMPTTFSWVDEDGIRQVGEGQSRDISASGTFVFAVRCPAAGATVGLNIFFSFAPEVARTLEIRAEARVLRVEQAGRAEETTGFAVRNQRVVILRDDEVIDEWTPPMTGPSENGELGKMGNFLRM